MQTLPHNFTQSTQNTSDPRSTGRDVPAVQSPPLAAPRPVVRGYRTPVDFDREYLADNARELMIDMLAAPVEADLSTVDEFLTTLRLALEGSNGQRPFGPAFFFEKVDRWTKFDRQLELQKLLIRFLNKWNTARRDAFTEGQAA